MFSKAREPSLENRRLKLSLQYTVKLKTNPLNPAHACVFHPQYQPLYDSKPTSIRPLGLRVRPHLQGRAAEPTCSPVSSHRPILNQFLTDFKHITAMSQNMWDESPLNKLHEIAPIVNEPRTHHLSTHRDQSVFNTCQIGHSRLTHEFLLKGEPPPECIPCNWPLTVNDLLIECVDFNNVWQRSHQVPSLGLQDLFKTVKPEVI